MKKKRKYALSDSTYKFIMQVIYAVAYISIAFIFMLLLVVAIMMSNGD